MSTVAFIDTMAHQSARDFYAWSPSEPVGNSRMISISKRVAVDGMSLFTLAKSMVAKLPSSSPSALICCHANDHALCIPVEEGVPGALNLERLRRVNAALTADSEAIY